MGIFRRKKDVETTADLTSEVSDNIQKPSGGKFTGKIKSFFKRTDITPEYWDELEEALLTSDVGMETTLKIVDPLRKIKKMDELKTKLSEIMHGILKAHQIEIKNKPHVIMVVGVNGTGKTTTIAKLANRYKSEGKKVLLVAADTFRAAAIEQLKVWGERLDLPVVAQAQDSDPAAVAFDGVKSAEAKGVDIVILDTAGRLHTNKNLMNELHKVKRVVDKALPGSPHDILLVLDATFGQNGLMQAKKFHEELGLTGAILAKMDGTAKGGVILSVANDLGIPVSFIGVGEGLGDIRAFNPDSFVQEILQ